MKRDVVLAPAPVLSAPAAAIEVVDDHVRSVCSDLLDTMRATAHSVGVAAPQIGVPLRICCVDVTGHPKTRTCHGELVIVNPRLVVSAGTARGREGCMSVPDLTGDVTRAEQITVAGLTPAGTEIEIHTDDFEARALQHELDHLDGLLFVDRVASARHLHTRRVYRPD
ncbi:MAG: peptide deformylase [Acidimicrobiia bacterium]|nr:peptide deformylase [Acidimicrobiia bacterium]